jgi:hypothetical protein
LDRIQAGAKYYVFDVRPADGKSFQIEIRIKPLP